MHKRTPTSISLNSIILAFGIIFLFAAALSVAILFHGSVCGDDSQFHLISWLDAQHSWKRGIPYPHWTPSPNYGGGEPRFVYYPPLSWMAGAALSLILPWRFVPAALIALLLSGIGIATLALARRLLPLPAAALAGCLALSSTYSLFTAYERAGFGELAGGIWIPLLLLFALQDGNHEAPVWQRALDGSTAPLALTFAACWLSDIPVGIMVSYLLAGTAFASAVLARSFFPLIRAAIAGALGFALTAFYLLPALLQQRWISPGEAVNGQTDPELVIQNNWLFSRPPLVQNGSRLSIMTIVSLSMILLALLSAIFLWWRARGPNRSFLLDSTQKRFFTIFVLISGITLCLQLPISFPIWNLLPKLRFLQFPFRWLVVLDAPMAVLFAGAIWPRKSRSFSRRASALAAGIVLMAVSIAYANSSFFRACEMGGSLDELLSRYRAGAGFWGAEEYAPPGSDNSTVPVSLPPACFTPNPTVDLDVAHAPNANPVWRPDQSACEPLGDFTLQQPEHLRIAGIVPRPGFAILRLRSYPAWHVTVDGQPITSFPTRIDGLIVVPVPKGTVQIEALWRNPPGIAAGWMVSMAALILCAALVAMNRRSPQTRD
jgi:hypothetical protein